MTKAVDLPKLADLPIPDDVRADGSWSGSMREMADHIGALATLRVAEAFGGQDIYVPLDPDASPLREVLAPDELATIARVYGGSRYAVPTAKRELTAARRAGVLAAVRAKRLSVADAARICGSSRTYISHLVNQTAEGRGAAISEALPTRARHDPRQIDLFEDLIAVP